MIEVFEAADVDSIVVNAAGCGSHLKEYGHLLRDEAGWPARAERLVAKGFGDSQPAVSPAGLTGAKLKAVRVMNRRVELHLISPLP